MPHPIGSEFSIVPSLCFNARCKVWRHIFISVLEVSAPTSATGPHAELSSYAASSLILCSGICPVSSTYSEKNIKCDTRAQTKKERKEKPCTRAQLSCIPESPFVTFDKSVMRNFHLASRQSGAAAPLAKCSRSCSRPPLVMCARNICPQPFSAFLLISRPSFIYILLSCSSGGVIKP